MKFQPDAGPCCISLPASYQKRGGTGRGSGHCCMGFRRLVIRCPRHEQIAAPHVQAVRRSAFGGCRSSESFRRRRERFGKDVCAKPRGVSWDAFGDADAVALFARVRGCGAGCSAGDGAKMGKRHAKSKRSGPQVDLALARQPARRAAQGVQRLGLRDVGNCGLPDCFRTATRCLPDCYHATARISSTGRGTPRRRRTPRQRPCGRRAALAMGSRRNSAVTFAAESPAPAGGGTITRELRCRGPSPVVRGLRDATRLCGLLQSPDSICRKFRPAPRTPLA